jgi:hypothetical protein
LSQIRFTLALTFIAALKRQFQRRPVQIPGQRCEWWETFKYTASRARRSSPALTFSKVA